MTKAVALEAPNRLVFLDGLRGWAAAIVVLCHLLPFFLLSHGPSAEWAHSLSNGTLLGHTEFALANIFLVFYRFLTDGLTPVYVFFVLSGFVLSAGFVKNRSIESISHQVLRRYIRLTVPVAAACLLSYILMRNSLMFNTTAGALVGSDSMLAYYLWVPSVKDFFKFAFFDIYFDYANDRTLGFVFWTIQIEFFGSFLIFATMAFFGKQSKRIFLYLGVGLITACVKIELTAFIVGLCLAEFRATPDFHRVAKNKWLRSVLIALSIPVVLSPIILFHFADRSLFAIAGTLIAGVIVLTVLVFPSVQRILSSKLSAFMGKISFSLYLLHPIVICSLTSWFVMVEYNRLTRPVLLGSAALLTLVVTIALARLFVVIDNAGTNLSRRFSNLVLNPSDSLVGISRTSLQGSSMLPRQVDLDR